MVVLDQLAPCRIALTCFAAEAQVRAKIGQKAYVASASCYTVTLVAMEIYRAEVGLCDMCSHTSAKIHRGALLLSTGSFGLVKSKHLLQDFGSRSRTAREKHH